MLNEVVTRLETAHENALLAITRLLAERVFKTNDDQAWLRRRFAMLRDVEDTPMYKRLVQKGELLRAQKDIEALVQRRFPSLLVFARTQIEPIADPDKLQEVLLEIATAPTINEAIQYLSELHL